MQYKKVKFKKYIAKFYSDMKKIYILLSAIVLVILMSDCQETPPCKKITDRIGVANPAAVYCKALGYNFKIVKTEKKLSADEKYAASIVPKRLVIGTLTFKGLPEELRRLSRWEPAYSTELNTPLFWIDGRRSLLEIYRLVRYETGRFDLRELIEYFSFLEKAGYVKLEKKRA